MLIIAAVASLAARPKVVPAQPRSAAPVSLAAPRPVALDWRVRGLDGTLRPLSQWRGRVVVLNMWASWCAPCVGEMESFRALRESLRQEGVDSGSVALLLLTPEPAGRVERFVRRRLADMPVFVEHDPMPAEFGVRAVPTTWILDREGRLVLAHRGAADWNAPAVRALLRRLADERDVRVDDGLSEAGSGGRAR